jgi:mono/diheme cytochrome c family protein
MAIAKATALVLGGALVFAGSLMSAAATNDRSAQAPLQARTMFSGKSLYSTYCSTCHGAEAKGNGPFAAAMKKRPADLTQIFKQNQGNYPAERIAKIIDGRENAAAHGYTDMPVWGDAFSKTREDSDEQAVHDKIEALVKYIETLQEKPATR